MAIGNYERWASRIKEASNGRLDIQVFKGSEIVKAAELLDAVSDGVVDMAFGIGAYWGGRFPEAGLMYGIPGTLRDLEDIRALCYEHGWIEKCREAYAGQGAYYLGPAGLGSVSLWAPTPVTTIEELQGFKIRAIGEVGTFWDRLGAAPTYIDSTEGYMALSLGTIDGFSSAFTVFRDLKHYEVAPYLMSPPVMGIALGEHLVNPKTWEKLPDDLKALLTMASDLMFYDHLLIPENPIPGYWADRTMYDLKAAGQDVYVTKFTDEAVATMVEVGLQMLDDKAKESPRNAEMV